jgi:hypothetical protein
MPFAFIFLGRIISVTARWEVAAAVVNLEDEGCVPHSGLFLPCPFRTKIDVWVQCEDEKNLSSCQDSNPGLLVPTQAPY